MIAYRNKALNLSYSFGLVFKNLGENEKAIDCYEKAIAINPNYVDAYNNLGIIFDIILANVYTIKYLIPNSNIVAPPPKNKFTIRATSINVESS